MDKLISLAGLVAAIGAAVLFSSGFAHAQVDGAVQYPPASVGKDAHPPPPAGMVPPIVSPRRIELGISGSSQAPAGSPFNSRLRPDTGRHEPTLGLSPEHTSDAGVN
jgi:hypothetical protein